jgi:Na+-translocating ferredoxin:NAD+ oxidoreductase subunit C
MESTAPPDTPRSPTLMRRLPLPQRLWIPCAGDAPPVGTRFGRGELISGSPAPASGRVCGTSPKVLLGAGKITTVIVEADAQEAGEDPPPPAQGKIQQVLGQLTASDLSGAIARLIAAGVHANRWTSPDLLDQLKSSTGKKMTAVVCSALDLDPVLPLQRTLIATRAMEVAAATVLLGKLVGTGQVFLAVPEDLTPVEVAALRAAAGATSIRLFPLPAEYPLAHPSLLLHRTLGRRLPPGQMPPEVGALVFDAPAAVAIADCFFRDLPMLHVPFGLYDVTRRRPHLLLVPVGMELSEVLRAIDVPSEFHELWTGQVLRELPASTDEIVGGGELTVFAAAPAAPKYPEACLRCGWCVEACPVRVHPAGLLDAAQLNDAQLADHYGLPSCIECGICTFVCPSQLPLLSSIRKIRSPANAPSAGG